MPRWGEPSYLAALTAEQVADFRCGIDGCSFGGRMTMAVWLERRAEHRAAEHPSFRERRRHRHTVPQAAGGSRSRFMTEREMEQAGVA